ncbi:MAG: hypothetical protein HY074_18540 [Deltaproteobacteria bacterium]|nr:hypothetical protein [Deltaproteobacteria bacterium]
MRIQWVCSLSGAAHSNSAPDSGGGGAATAASVTTGPPYNLVINWQANNETAVNRAGGGYLVYYAATSGQNLLTTPSITIPYVSGPKAPTTATITGLTIHSPSRVFIRVVAFSALATRAGPTAASAPSSELTIVVP